MKKNYGCIIGVWIIWFAVAYFYNIKPDYEYGWAWALFWQGPLSIPSWIISLFDPSKYCMAPLHTSGYAFWWWVILILNIFVQIGNLLAVFKQIFSKD